MNSNIFNQIRRFILLFLLQILVFKSISLNVIGYEYLHILFYPLFILLLPLNTPRPVVVALGFLMGICVDFFYDSIGMHAAALTFTAFVRPQVLFFLEPRGGYNVNYSPTIRRMGSGWFFQYATAVTILHLFFYFSVEAFTFVYIIDIILKTVLSYIASIVCILAYMFLLNPED